jgi:hypothetical protein
MADRMEWRGGGEVAVVVELAGQCYSRCVAWYIATAALLAPKVNSRCSMVVVLGDSAGPSVLWPEASITKGKSWGLLR